MLAGKVALVTGGGSGLGRAICQVMAREGARVVATDLDPAAARRTAARLTGADHVGLPLDVTSRSSVVAAVSDVIRRYGLPADCIVNCAGLLDHCPLHQLTEERFWRTIDVNLKGTFLVTQLATEALVAARRPGAVVNVSSIGGRTGHLRLSAYTASKAGVDGFSRSVALELAPAGIRCNAVLPGLVLTPMTEERVENASPGGLQRVIALGRGAQPQEVAEVVAFVASDRASYMTGESINVDGAYGPVC